MNGGYSLIDCSGVDLAAESGSKVTGLYNKFKEAYTANKLVVLVNVKNGDNAYSPFTPILYLNQSDIVITIPGEASAYKIGTNDTVEVVD